MLIDFNHHSTSYRSHSSSSPCTSSDTASSSYSTASTSCGPSTSTPATSASPCPPPCPIPEDFDIETDLLVAVCATLTDSSDCQGPESSMSKGEIWMQWQDNAVHLEIGQKNMDKCSKLEKRKRESDEREAKRIRNKERKVKKKVEEGKEGRKFYDFIASVNSTTRIRAPIEDWGHDDLEGWSTTIGTVDSKSVPGRENNIWKSQQPVKEEVPVLVESVVPLPTVITPISVHTQDDSLCEIRHVPGKGLGVIATANITQGQAIVTESPFLMVDHPPNLHQVKSRLAKLPSDLQNLFHTFNPSLSPHHTHKIVDVIVTNVIPLGDEPLINLDDEILPLDAEGEVEQRCRSGLFETICRVNHSCTPNSRWTWFDAGHMILRSLRPIAKGEEITACYLQDTAMSHEDRQQTLFNTWGFVCTCPLCDSPPDRQNIEDDRRERFRDIRDEYIGLAKEDTWHRDGLVVCSAKIKKAIKLLEKGGQEGEVGDCRWSLFLLSVRWGDEDKARREGSAWLRQVMKMGDDPGDQYRGLVRKPRTAIDWGMWDDDRSGDESECDSNDDFEQTYRALNVVKLQSAPTSSIRTSSRSSRRTATMTGARR